MTTITDKLAEALAEAAQSLETIAKNAGKVRDQDGEENMLRHHDQVRGYATSRATVARAELADYASQQAEPSSGSNAAAPVVAGPSDARVEAAVVCCGDWATCRQPCVPRANHWQASAVPDGFVLVPEKATPLIREALRIGMRREVPDDELCDIRWRAAIAAAAPGSEQKEGK